MRDRRERNIEKGGREREEEKGGENMLKRCVRVSRAGSDWSTPLLTPFAPATWLSMDLFFSVRAPYSPLFPLLFEKKLVAFAGGSVLFVLFIL